MVRARAFSLVCNVHREPPVGIRLHARLGHLDGTLEHAITRLGLIREVDPLDGAHQLEPPTLVPLASEHARAASTLVQPPGFEHRVVKVLRQRLLASLLAVEQRHKTAVGRRVSTAPRGTAAHTAAPLG